MIDQKDLVFTAPPPDFAWSVGGVYRALAALMRANPRPVLWLLALSFGRWAGFSAIEQHTTSFDQANLAAQVQAGLEGRYNPNLWDGGWLLWWLIASLAYCFFIPGVYASVVDARERGEPATLRQALRWSAATWLSYASAQLLVGLGILFGLCFLLLPGLLIYTWSFLVLPAAVFTDLRSAKDYRAVLSWMTPRRQWLTLKCLGVSWLATFAVQLCCGAVVGGLLAAGVDTVLVFLPLLLFLAWRSVYPVPAAAP